VIAVDTKLLVYAHRSDSEWNQKADACLRKLASQTGAWAIPWPCLYEFYAIVTHPKIYVPPSTPDEALAQLEAWLEAPSIVLLSEEASHWPCLREKLRRARVAGPLVHDARIAALCRAHGVRELWTADRDFSRFTELCTKNPLTDPGVLGG
jgi:toxin-antitoxin system PIN domain toxin